jgi:hypothetical protein
MVKPELTAEEKLLQKEQQALAAQEEKEKRAAMTLKFLKVPPTITRFDSSGETCA